MIQSVHVGDTVLVKARQDYRAAVERVHGHRITVRPISGSPKSDRARAIWRKAILAVISSAPPPVMTDAPDDLAAAIRECETENVWFEVHYKRGSYRALVWLPDRSDACGPLRPTPAAALRAAVAKAREGRS